jgi:hypothetical protein
MALERDTVKQPVRKTTRIVAAAREKYRLTNHRVDA